METDRQQLRDQYRFRNEAIYLEGDLISQRSWRDYFDEVVHLHRNYWLGIKYRDRATPQDVRTQIVFNDGTQRRLEYSRDIVPNMSVYWYNKPLFTQMREVRQEYRASITILTTREIPANTRDDPSGVPLPSSTRDMLKPHMNTFIANYYRNLLQKEDRLVTAYDINMFQLDQSSDYKRFTDPIQENRAWIREEFKERGYVETSRSYHKHTSDQWYVKADAIRMLHTPFHTLYNIGNVAERIYQDHGLVVQSVSNAGTNTEGMTAPLWLRNISDNHGKILSEPKDPDQYTRSYASLKLILQDHDGTDLSTEVDWLAFAENKVQPGEVLSLKNHLLSRYTFGPSDMEDVYTCMVADRNDSKGEDDVHKMLKSNDRANEVLFRSDLKRVLEADWWTHADIERATAYGAGVELDVYGVAGSYISWRRHD